MWLLTFSRVDSVRVICHFAPANRRRASHFADGRKLFPCSSRRTPSTTLSLPPWVWYGSFLLKQELSLFCDYSHSFTMSVIGPSLPSRAAVPLRVLSCSSSTSTPNSRHHIPRKGQTRCLHAPSPARPYTRRSSAPEKCLFQRPVRRVCAWRLCRSSFANSLHSLSMHHLLVLQPKIHMAYLV
jgi:hypothetical protein